MATIIIYSKTKEKITGTCRYEWTEHKFRRLADGTPVITSRMLDKEAAKRVISRLGLVPCFREEYGTIYDTPSHDLKTIFPNGLRSKEDIAIIEKADMI